MKFRTEPNAKVTLVAKYVDMLIDVVNFFPASSSEPIGQFQPIWNKASAGEGFLKCFFQGRVKTPKWGDNILRNSSEKGVY